MEGTATGTAMRHRRGHGIGDRQRFDDRSLWQEVAFSEATEIIKKLEGLEGCPATISLTTKEIEVISLIATGYRHNEISRMLNISRSAVKERLSTAKKRTGARTTAKLLSMYLSASQG
jgi:DNA-binding NarL/FixJ family response regulator